MGFRRTVTQNSVIGRIGDDFALAELGHGDRDGLIKGLCLNLHRMVQALLIQI